MKETNKALTQDLNEGLFKEENKEDLAFKTDGLQQSLHVEPLSKDEKKYQASTLKLRDRLDKKRSDVRDNMPPGYCQLQSSVL